MKASDCKTTETAALYLHIPFCERRCNYCDFYTVADRSEAIPQYIAALQREMALYAGDGFWARCRFATVYFGGGTPSLLAPEQLAELLEAAHRAFAIEADAEISMEANPGAISAGQLAGYRAAGVNRLSLGVQSFWPDELAQLDRLHTVEHIYETVTRARAAGFTNLSIDLMFALPGQRPHRWRETLRKAVALGPEHISAYNLTFEEGTPLFRLLQCGRVRPLSEWKAKALYRFSIDELRAHGFAQYEVSNFARPGFQCRHNEKYWDGSAYLGLGASAHSYDGRQRFWNIDNYVQYIRQVRQDQRPVKGQERLTQEQKRFEMIFLGLRRQVGLDLQTYRQTFGREFAEEYGEQVAALCRAEPPLLEIADGHARLTPAGLAVCDAVCAAFG